MMYLLHHLPAVLVTTLPLSLCCCGQAPPNQFQPSSLEVNRLLSMAENDGDVVACCIARLKNMEGELGQKCHWITFHAIGSSMLCHWIKHRSIQQYFSCHWIVCHSIGPYFSCHWIEPHAIGSDFMPLDQTLCYWIMHHSNGSCGCCPVRHLIGIYVIGSELMSLDHTSFYQTIIPRVPQYLCFIWSYII